LGFLEWHDFRIIDIWEIGNGENKIQEIDLWENAIWEIELWEIKLWDVGFL